MPAHSVVGVTKNDHPACSREKAAGSGKEDSIGGFQLWPRNLATQDTELVLEHDDLQLLELARAKAECGQLQATTKNEVDKRHGHEHERTPPERAGRPLESTGHDLIGSVVEIDRASG
jgi:hypothetical protein